MVNLLALVHENLSADPQPVIDQILRRAYQVFPDEYQIDREAFNQTLNRLAASDTLFRLWLLTHREQFLERLKRFNDETEAAGLAAETDMDRSLGQYASRYGFN